MKSKMIYIIIITLLALGLVAYFLLKPKYQLSQTISSPNSEYSLDVYVQSDFKHTGFSNQNDFKKAYVVLKNNKEDVIAKPSLLTPCRFIIGDLKVFWELENDKVFFTKFNSINLKSKTYSCQ